jgi:hypothetical protein
MSVRAMPAAAAALVLLTCVGRPQAPAVVAADDPPDLAPAVEPEPWRVLVDMEIEFQPPDPLDVEVFPDPPTELPRGAVQERWDLDRPQLDRSSLSTWCKSPRVPNACARVKQDVRGAVVTSYRYEYEHGKPSLVSSRHASGSRFERCWYDALGGVTRRQIHEQSGTRWSTCTRQVGYDEHGVLLFSESLDSSSSDLVASGNTYAGCHGSAVVYDISSSEGRPSQIARYQIDYMHDEDFELDQIETHTWIGDRIAQTDFHDGTGRWTHSLLYLWHRDYVRRSEVYPSKTPGSARVGRSTIHLRRGPYDYVPVFDAPDTRWEHTIADDITTSTKYVGELIVERRRVQLIGDERRTLTVEQRPPDGEDLVTTQRWDWSPDRVVVDRDDGRETYLFDCSELPPIDESFDPATPPPLPLREWTEVPRPQSVEQELCGQYEQDCDDWDDGED